MNVKMEILEKKLVGCKWVFTIKYRVDETFERYRTRLVNKGCTQTYVIDYQETFVLIAKKNKLRILLFLATNFDWYLQ